MKIENPIYYVGVQTGDFEKRDYHLTLVTEINYITKTWKAENDKKPLVFIDKEHAEEFVMCLQSNLVFAVVICSAGEITGQPFINHNI